jgi:chromosome segregation ATPase|nr:MAG TPA: hypothetical protein [Caudoviricetes sp.]
MTILHHSTYTNYHEQNLDEIMRIIGSFDETLKTLNERYNDIIANYNRFDTRLSDFEIEVKKLRNQFSDFKTELNLNVTNFKGEVITKINTQNDKIDKLVADVNNRLQNLGENILIYNQLTGTYTTLSELMNAILALSHNGVYSLNELANLHINVQQFDSLNMSVYDFDWNNKKVLASYQ